MGIQVTPGLLFAPVGESRGFCEKDSRQDIIATSQGSNGNHKYHNGNIIDASVTTILGWELR